MDYGVSMKDIQNGPWKADEVQKPIIIEQNKVLFLC